jgi:hypothetical protein
VLEIPRQLRFYLKPDSRNAEKCILMIAFGGGSDFDQRYGFGTKKRKPVLSVLSDTSIFFIGSNTPNGFDSLLIIRGSSSASF